MPKTRKMESALNELLLRSCTMRKLVFISHYEDKYNWDGLELLVAIKKIGKFKKNNEDIAVNVLHIHHKEEGKSKGTVTIFRVSEFNGKRSKQVNLLLIIDGKKAITHTSRTYQDH